ncbi:MAG: pitrilysin family protein [Candidatus Hatepunaea meridiana]|nr:pitrilysin family protein [Candidatus Hatepunaea meridiana]
MNNRRIIVILFVFLFVWCSFTIPVVIAEKSETVRDESIASTARDESIASTARDKSIASTARDKSVASTARDKSVASTARDKSVASTARDKSVASTARDESIASTARDKSIASTARDKSVASTYKDIDIPELQWQIPKYSEFKSKNGIAGLVVEDNEVPLVYFVLSFPVSPDPADKVGLAEMTAWTLRNGGSVNIPADSLNDIVEFKSAWIGVWAGQEQFHISGSGHKDDLPMLMNLAKELILNPAYSEDKIELKRSTMLEKIRRRYDRPNGIAHRELNKLIYPDHPFGRETSEATVNSITRDDLLAYHKQIFDPSSAIIGFSGDITLSKAKSLTKKYLKKLKKRQGKIVSIPSTPKQAGAGVYYAYKDVSQAFITMGHQTIDYNNPQRHAAEIMNRILGGSGFNSLLTKRIRVDEGLTYSIWSMFSSPVPVKGKFKASASTRIDQAGRTLALMTEIITDYQENGPSEEQFENAKQAIVNSYVWKYESSDNFLYRLTYLKWRGLPLDTPQRDLEAYQKLTLEDVRKAAKELLHPDKLIIVMVGDKEKLDRPLEDFGTIHELNIE